MTISAFAIDPLPFGWLSPIEADLLAALAVEKVVLEIGSFLGRSTIILARHAQLVVSIDHHRGSGEHQPGQPDCRSDVLNRHGVVDTAPAFLENITNAGVRQRVVPFVGSIETAGALLAPERFDLVFVDGEHSRQATLDAGAIAFRLAKRDGILAFHDVGDRAFPGVADAVATLAGTFGARSVRQAGSIVALQRQV
jgi:predicted O-methyltransferase YrrM